jgi:hypothetical protein
MISSDDWTLLAGLIDEWWPGEFGETAAEAWRVGLEGYESTQVGAALRALLARGGTFRPSVSEIIAEIRRDPAKPTFAEAYTLIFGRDGVLSVRTRVSKAWWEAGERERLDDEAKLERARELHPLISAFIHTQGLDRLKRLDIDHPEYGEVRRKQLQGEWEEFCDANETRDVAELVAGRGRGELGRFDPLRVLPAAARAQLKVIDGLAS